jgi:glycerophosphoryl diester phosphodiesterase
VKAGRPAIVAHRGFHATAPENSLEAFAAAVELGVDMVELDVQETADGELVVRHEDVGGLAYDELGAPRLSEALAVLDGLGVDVEIKQASAGRLAEELGKARAPHVVTSFDPDALRRYGAEAPATKRGLIVEGGEHDAASLLRIATGAAIDFLVLQEALASDELLDAVSELGPPFVWAVDDQASLTRFLSHPRVGGVITDRPDLALAVRRALCA